MVLFCGLLMGACASNQPCANEASQRTLRVVTRVYHGGAVPMECDAGRRGAEGEAVHLGNPRPAAGLDQQVVRQPPRLMRQQHHGQTHGT